MKDGQKVAFYGARPIRGHRIDAVGWALLALVGVASSAVAFCLFTMATYFSVRFLQWLGAL